MTWTVTGSPICHRLHHRGLLTAGAVYIVLSSQLASLQTGDTLEDIAHLRLLGTRTDDSLEQR